MAPNRRMLEEINIQAVMLPVDLNDGATTGDYVSLKNYGKCLVVLIAGDGTAGSDVDVLLYQATNVAGDDAKVLNCLETGRIFTKEGAAALTSAGTWTKETQATADEAWDPEDSGEVCLIWGFEVFASDLDGDNGFDCIRADVTDPGAAKIGVALYILGDPKNSAAPELMADPLID